MNFKINTDKSFDNRINVVELSNELKGGWIVKLGPSWLVMSKVVVICLSLGVFLFNSVYAQDQNACMGDSLYIESPSDLEVELSSDGKFGTILTWAEKPDADTTCSLVIDTFEVDFEIDVVGAYSDVVDRELKFYVDNAGEIGSKTQNRVVLGWNNANQEATGTIVGEVNLSNSGGVYFFNSAVSEWEQSNFNIPMTLPYTDINALVSAPLTPGKLFMQLSSNEFFYGLWMKDSEESGWNRIAEIDFPNGRTSSFNVTVASFDSEDSNTLLLGTESNGVWLSTDNGVSFNQITSGFEEIEFWSTSAVTAINWFSPSLVYLAIENRGLFVSNDSGNSFEQINIYSDTNGYPESVPSDTTSVICKINAISVDENDAVNHFFLAVDDFCLYETDDGGGSWSWPAEPLVNTALETVEISATGAVLYDDKIIIATESNGIQTTNDDGETWICGTESLFGEDIPNILSIVNDVSRNRLLAVADQFGLLESDFGFNWSVPPVDLPGNKDCTSLMLADDSVLWVATEAGGIYQPGTLISLSSTIYDIRTDVEYRGHEFGLEISFDEGSLVIINEGQDDQDTSRFSLLLQDFQGYAVWRSMFGSREDMQIVGLYDKNNPETCMLGYCGNENVPIEPQCWKEKRSACFDFSNPGTVTFFDDGVYNGFIYYYAVSTFDYGNTATVSGPSTTNDPWYSPRFAGDPLVPIVDGSPLFDGDGNITQFNVDKDAVELDSEAEIFVFPNPLRLEEGFPESPGELVTFTNLNAESRVVVYTLSGDLIVDLSPDLQVGRNLKWFTRNYAGELLASGVYIYKVESPGREDYFGKLIIIR
jgi:hypothetical protein